MQAFRKKWHARACPSSARVAERNSDTARTSEQPRTVILGAVDKLIPSSRPSQPEKAQISIEGNHGYRCLRIENSLTNEHGDEVKLKKGTHVEVTVTAQGANVDNWYENHLNQP